MSLYELVIGKNKHAVPLMLLLGFEGFDDVGRFRDCYLNDGMICVLTRNGGGNREEYKEVIEKLQKHPLYVKDNDEDDIDSTYASFYFKIPTVEQLPPEIKESIIEQGAIPEEILALYGIRAKMVKVSLKERFEKAMADIKEMGRDFKDVVKSSS